MARLQSCRFGSKARTLPRHCTQTHDEPAWCNRTPRSKERWHSIDLLKRIRASFDCVFVPWSSWGTGEGIWVWGEWQRFFRLLTWYKLVSERRADTSFLRSIGGRTAKLRRSWLWTLKGRRLRRFLFWCILRSRRCFCLSRRRLLFDLMNFQRIHLHWDVQDWMAIWT